MNSAEVPFRNSLLAMEDGREYSIEEQSLLQGMEQCMESADRELNSARLYDLMIELDPSQYAFVWNHWPRDTVPIRRRWPLLPVLVKYMALKDPLKCLQLIEHESNEVDRNKLIFPLVIGWANKDFQKCWDWVNSLDSHPQQDQLKYTALEQYLLQKPVETFALVERSFNGTDQYEAVTRDFLKTWAYFDVVQASKFLSSHQTKFQDIRIYQEYAYTLAASRPELATEFAESIHVAKLKEAALRGVEDLEKKVNAESQLLFEQLAAEKDSLIRIGLIKKCGMQLMRIDHRRAFDWVNGLEDEHERGIAFSSIAKSLVSRDWRLVLENIEKIPDSSTKDSVSNVIVQRWIKVDPEACLEWILTFKSSTFRRYLLTSASMWIEDGDFTTAAMFLKKLPTGEERLLVLADHVETMAENSFQATFDLVLEHFEGRELIELGNRLLGVMAKENPARAIELTNRFPSNQETVRLYDSLLYNWGRNDIKSCIQWVLSQKDQVLKNEMLRRMSSLWIRFDPVNARNYVDNLPANQLRADLLFSMVNALSSADPKAGVLWVQSFKDKGLTNELLPGIIYRWAQASGREAAIYADEIGEDSIRKMCLLQVADAWGRNYSQEATRWMSDIVDTEIKTLTTAITWHHWLHFDNEGAMKWLKEMPVSVERDKLLFRYLNDNDFKYDHFAMHLVMLISNSKMKTDTMILKLRLWYLKDANKAVEWIDRSNLPEELKRVLKDSLDMDENPQQIPPQKNEVENFQV